MKKENNNKNKSIYTLIFSSYILFLVAVILIGIVSLKIINSAEDRILDYSSVYSFSNEKNNLINEKFEEIKASKYLGSDGYFEVLDSDGSVIYSSDESKKNTYTSEQISFIPLITDEEYYTFELIIYENNVHYVLNDYKLIENEFQLVRAIITDNDGTILYSDPEIDSDNISSKELSYILLEYQNDNTYVQKYEYEDANGNVRYVLLHVGQFQNDISARIAKIYGIVFVCLVVVFVVLMILFTLYLNGKILKPIKVLDDSIKSLSENKDIKIESFEGPREIADALKSFDEMSDKLAKSAKENEILEEEKKKMLADISHDLKTPVTVIQGYAKALNDGLVKEGDEEKYLNIISSKAELLSELVNTFYEYSRLEHPDFDVKKEEGDICEYLREYVASRYEELDMMGFLVDVDIPEEKIMMSFDNGLLKRVFENIINNAVKHNDRGTTIYASIKNKGSYLSIKIGDDGKGIDDSIREDIFKPFVVGDSARTSGKGTGLGLSIAKKIVDAHGATISLCSKDEYPRGTMFEIKFLR